jgi:hypothetical protein
MDCHRIGGRVAEWCRAWLSSAHTQIECSRTALDFKELMVVMRCLQRTESLRLALFVVGLPVMLVLAGPMPTSVGAQARPPTGGAVTPPPQGNVAARTPSPIDLDAENLPAGFVPADPRKVFAGLTLPKKGDFETTEQYAARMAAPVQPAIHAFSLQQTVGHGTSSSGLGTAKYDADKQELSVELYLDSRDEDTSTEARLAAMRAETREDADHYSLPAIQARVAKRAALQAAQRDHRSLLLKSVTTAKRHYRASTAFGVSGMIEEEKADQYYLNVTSKDAYPASLKVSVKMTPEVARAAMSAVGMLIITGGGHASTGSVTQSQATIDNPSVFIRHVYNLDAPVKGIWLYNTKTGTVYQKFDEALLGSKSDENE